MLTPMKRIAALCPVFILLAIWLAQPTLAQKSTTVEREVGAFDQLRIGGSFEVVLRQGAKPHVTLEVRGTDPENIETEVIGSSLEVRLRRQNNGWEWSRNVDVKVTITYTSLRSIRSSGSSEIVAESVLTGPILDLRSSGSGSLRAKVEADELNIEMSGSGSVEVTGRAKAQTISLSGSGGVRARDLESERVQVSISGSADADVYATKEIETRISGSGNVRYRGNPERQILKSSGSGTARKVN
jgi:hypothetical protein